MSWFGGANSCFKHYRYGLGLALKLSFLILLGHSAASNAAADVKVEKVELLPGEQR
ncbi:MAG: hypothetical protein WBL50_21705 [Candidatus Acidiferrum sp.]